MNDKELVRELMEIDKKIQFIIQKETLKNYNVQAIQIGNLLNEINHNQDMPLAQLYRTDSPKLFLNLTVKIQDLYAMLTKEVQADSQSIEREMYQSQFFASSRLATYLPKVELKQKLANMLDILTENKPMLSVAAKRSL